MNSRSTNQRDKTIKTDSRTLTNDPTSIKTFDERRVAIPNFTSGDLQLLDEKVKSMMEKSQNLIPSGRQKAYICKVCGKEGAGIAIRDHIEANHLEGVSLPCNVCGKECRSRMILRKHTCVPKWFFVLFQKEGKNTKLSNNCFVGPEQAWEYTRPPCIRTVFDIWKCLKYMQ